MIFVHGQKGEPMQPPYEDYCYECTAYEDDTYINYDGKLVSRCPECPYNDWEDDDETD